MKFLSKSNFASTVLTSAIGSSDGEDATFTVSDGSSFPSVGEFLIVVYLSTCNSPTECSAREIIRIKSRSGNTFTIKARDQEGTSHSDPNPPNGVWAIGSKVILALTAGQIKEIESAINSAVMINNNYIITDTDGYAIIFVSGDTQITLPSASIVRTLRIINTDANNPTTIVRAGSDTIEGKTSLVLNAKYDSVTLVSDGDTTWYIL